MKMFLIVTAFTFTCFGIAGIASKSIVEEEIHQSVGASENAYIVKPMEKSFKLSEVKSLVFETANADLEIVPKEDLKDEVLISYQELYQKKNETQLYYPIIEEVIKDQTLKIGFGSPKEEMKSNNTIKFKKTDRFPYFSILVLSPDSKIKMYVPSNFKFESLSLEIVNGDIHIPSMNLNQLKVELVNGDVNVKGVESNKLSVALVNGDININDIKSLDVDLHTVSGDINLDGISLSHDYKIETVTGDVSIRSLDALDSNLKINSLAGDIEIDGEDFEDFVVKTSETSKSNFKIDVTAGDVSFKTNQKL